MSTQVLAWQVDGASLSIGNVQQRWQEHTPSPVGESGQGSALLLGVHGPMGTVGPMTLRWHLSGQLQLLDARYEGYSQLANGSIQALTQINPWQVWAGMARLDVLWPLSSRVQLVLTGALDVQRQSRNLLQYTEHMTRHTTLGGVGLHWQFFDRWGLEVEALQSVAGRGHLSAPALAFAHRLSVRQSLSAAQAYWRVSEDSTAHSGQWVLRWEKRRTAWGASDEVGGLVFPGAQDRQVTSSLHWIKRW